MRQSEQPHRQLGRVLEHAVQRRMPVIHPAKRDENQVFLNQVAQAAGGDRGEGPEERVRVVLQRNGKSPESADPHVRLARIRQRRAIGGDLRLCSSHANSGGRVCTKSWPRQPDLSVATASSSVSNISSFLSN